MSDDPIARSTDPDGREVVFDEHGYRHLASRRANLLDHLDVIMGAVSLPDHRGPDPDPNRERFYRQNALDPGRWLRVVVDFSEAPGHIVTVLVQFNDPRKKP